MTVRDLDQTELKYLNRDLLAERVAKLQAERAALEAEIKALREALAEQAPVSA
jgi:cell division protein FtsB